MERSESFNIEIADRYVRVAGEMDLRTAPMVQDAVLNLADPVPLDLADVTFMDSSGLHVLITLRRTRPQMRVVAVSPRVEQLLVRTNTRSRLCDDQNTRSV